MAQALAQSLNPLQGGSDSRDLATTSKLQILQQFSFAGNGIGKHIQSVKDSAIYVGMVNSTNKLAMQKTGDVVKEENGTKDKKGQPIAVGSKQQNKIHRTNDDGLLLVVPARINGHIVRALIDSGATRCFVTPSCITAVGLKGTP